MCSVLSLMLFCCHIEDFNFWTRDMLLFFFFTLGPTNYVPSPESSWIIVQPPCSQWYCLHHVHLYSAWCKNVGNHLFSKHGLAWECRGHLPVPYLACALYILASFICSFINWTNISHMHPLYQALCYALQIQQLVDECCSAGDVDTRQ